MVEEEGLGDDVGGVEARDAERYDVVKGGGGTDVYEANDAGCYRSNDDCVNWDGSAFLNLWFMSESVIVACRVQIALD